MTVQRLPLYDTDDAKSIFDVFVGDLLAAPYAINLAFADLESFACMLDICKTPDGKFCLFYYSKPFN